MPEPDIALLTQPPARMSAVLNVGQLDAWTAEAEQQLLREGESINTVRTYRTALRYWAVWHALRYAAPLRTPVPVETVVQFIVDHAVRQGGTQARVTELPAEVDAELVRAGVKARTGPPALNTLQLRLAVLSRLHQWRGHDNPCALPRVRELMSSVRRAHARRGEQPRRQAALTREPLEALLATCDDSLAGRRDRALLLFAFASGGRRRAEVSAARIEDLEPTPDGYRYTLLHSKTNQGGQLRADSGKPVVGRAALALRDWLEAAGLRSGPIFRRVRRGGVIGEPLAPAAVRDIVRRRCVAAGLPADSYSAHSLRAGFVTEAARQKVPLAETMAMTGHRSTASVVGYYRASAPGPGARLMDDEVEPSPPADRSLKRG